MPDITAPAMLAYTGGTLRQWRVVPARVTFTAGAVTSVRDSAVSGAAEVPKLNRIYRLADKLDGESDKQFQRRRLIWQQTMEAIEAAFAAVNQRVDDLAAILARLTAAEQLAQAANDNAISAAAQVEAVSAAVADTFGEVDPVLRDGYTNRVNP